MADLTKSDGTLVYCTPLERDLIYAIRADPDQHQHIVEVEPEGDDWFTIRHPIMERLQRPEGGDLFDCGVFDALQRLDPRDWPEEVGRYRVTLSQISDGSGPRELVDFVGPL
jgi:hypothetical protein